MSEVNTDERFKCPDGHMETVQAGHLATDTYGIEKWWCTCCKKLFYIHSWNGYRFFCKEKGSYEIDSSLFAAEGFTQKDGGIIVKDADLN